MPATASAARMSELTIEKICEALIAQVLNALFTVFAMLLGVYADQPSLIYHSVRPMTQSTASSHSLAVT